MSKIEVIKRGQNDMLKQLLSMDPEEAEKALSESDPISPRSSKSPRRRNARFSMSMSQDFENEGEEEEDDDEEEEEELKFESNYLALAQAKQKFLSGSENMLNFSEYELIYIIEKTQKEGWWFGENQTGNYGYFPSSFVKIKKEYSQTTKFLISKNLKELSLKSNARNTLLKSANDESSEIIGNFKLRDYIGKTALDGRKYTATHVRNKHTVALLQFSNDQFLKSEKNAIIRKINQLASLQHPNLIQHRGAVRDENYFCVVTGFNPGENLHEMIERYGVFNESQIIPFIYQILDALLLLHKNNVIHGRVCASNIVLDKNTNKIILGEQGFIELLNQDNKKHDKISDPYWFAPEILEQKKLGVSIDIWSLGCTIIELLTGNPPYFDKSVLQACFSIIENGFSDFPADISYSMIHFLKLCFRKEPFTRPTTLELLQHSLFNSLRSSNDIILSNSLKLSTASDLSASFESTSVDDEFDKDEEEFVFFSFFFFFSFINFYVDLWILLKLNILKILKKLGNYWDGLLRLWMLIMFLMLFKFVKLFVINVNLFVVLRKMNYMMILENNYVKQ